MLDYAKFWLKPGEGTTNYNGKFEGKLTLRIRCFAAEKQYFEKLQVEVLEVNVRHQLKKIGEEKVLRPVQYFSDPPFTGVTLKNGREVEFTLYLRYNVSYAFLFHIQDEPEPVLGVPIRYGTLLVSLSDIIRKGEK